MSGFIKFDIMELTFPFKNVTINNLLHFTKCSNIVDYIITTSHNDPNVENIFNTYVRIYRDSLPNFENELLQTIETTDQLTIDRYFYLLAENFDYVKSYINRDTLLKSINEYNSENIERFEREIEQKTDEYFKDSNRKLEHLEVYEDTEVSFLTAFRPQKINRVNYNYYCVNEKPTLIDLDFFEDYLGFINELSEEFFQIGRKYGGKWHKKEIRSRSVLIKPVVYVEGPHDVKYIELASKLLGREDEFDQIDIRYRGGASKLDKMWQELKNENWETFIQRKLLIYDHDTSKPDEDSGHHFRRTLPYFDQNPVERGIENLFSRELLNKAINHDRTLVDVCTSRGFERGVPFERESMSVHRMEKTELCDWICKNATVDDFQYFSIIFNWIKELLLINDND